VNHGGNVDNIHRAGAHYALSISDISGEMLSSRLLGRPARVRDERRRVVRLTGAPFAGLPVGTLLARQDGWCILGIDRGGLLIPHAQAETIAAGDAIWLCGTAEAIRELSGH
jgi:Trk K+ transport system NAD-binding subunit